MYNFKLSFSDKFKSVHLKKRFKRNEAVTFERMKKTIAIIEYHKLDEEIIVPTSRISIFEKTIQSVVNVIPSLRNNFRYLKSLFFTVYNSSDVVGFFILRLIISSHKKFSYNAYCYKLNSY